MPGIGQGASGPHDQIDIDIAEHEMVAVISRPVTLVERKGLADPFDLCVAMPISSRCELAARRRSPPNHRLWETRR